jgi:predicted nucleic acid-binding protein
MYLVDTDVISEIRKGEKANAGVRAFFESASRGRLRVPNPENPLDKQIAATALIHDLTVVTRNTEHFAPTGVRIKNPFV